MLTTTSHAMRNIFSLAGTPLTSGCRAAAACCRTSPLLLHVTLVAFLALDFESQVAHTFFDQVVDAWGQGDAASVTVVLSDKPEGPVFNSPPGGGDWKFDLSEMARAGTMVGVLSLDAPQGDIVQLNVYEGDIGDSKTWIETPAFRAEKPAHLGFARLVVANEWELDHEAKPRWNLVLEAVDRFENSDTAAVTVNLADEVEWGSTGVFLVSEEVAIAGFATGDHHAGILIIPADPETHKARAEFTGSVWVQREKVVYTIIGAEPEAGSSHPALISQIGRNGIDEDRWTQRGTIQTLDSSAAMIEWIISLDRQYGDHLEYGIFPEPVSPIDWSSNGYIHGLLNALVVSDASASFTFNDDGLDFPGWQEPLALSEFGVDVEE